jgi:hypothetical protein
MNIEKQITNFFPYIKISNGNLLASTLLDKSGRPLVRIDSKEPIKALMLKINSDSIVIKSIVNSTTEKGFSKKIIDIILNSVSKDFRIIINQDVSGGFWDKIIKLYPSYNWIKL